jgi:hypothetical protein
VSVDAVAEADRPSSAAAVTSTDHRARRLQRLAAALAFVAAFEALGVVIIGSSGDSRFFLEPNLVTVGFLGSIVLFPVVGALVVQRRAYTRVAWLMIVVGVALGLGVVTAGYGLIGQPSGRSFPGRSLPFALEALVLSQLFFVPALAGATSFMLLLFPTDRLLSRGWRVAGWVAVAGSVLYEVGAIFRAGELDPESLPGLVNPIAAPPDLAPAVALIGALGNGLAAFGLTLATASLVVRYRRADPVVAAQIRWLALVAVLAVATFIPSALQIGLVSDVAFGLGLVFLACMPIAIGIAITRYRLYEIDRLINRALVYGSLTAILAGVFTAAVGLAQRLFVAYTGQTSDAAIVLTTLVVATLYAPLRKRLEDLVDRWFKYESREFGAYRAELMSFLALTDRDRAARRLAAEAVKELRATGAAVVDSAGQALATTGEWPHHVSIRLPVGRGDRVMGMLLVGPRADGQPHDAREVEELADLAILVGLAIARG